MLFFVSLKITQAQHVVKSPDSKLHVNVSVEEGKPVYDVVYNGKVFLEKSPLGLNTNLGDFTKNMVMVDEPKTEYVQDTYYLNTIKQSQVDYQANKAVFTFTHDNDTIYDVIFLVSNNDIAFQYKLYPQKDYLSMVVKNEATGFVFPQGTTTFLCPQSGPMGGFARTSPSYETPYTADEAMGSNGWGEGYTFPGLFRNQDHGWILVSETGVSSLYCGSRLMGGTGSLYTIGYPQEGEYNGNGTVSPGISLPGELPWRTVTVGETLEPIVHTTIAFDVVKPLYESNKEFILGRGSWSWIIGGDNSVTYDETKRYIDFSAAMTYESVLVDNWWDKQIGKVKIEELARYAESKNVGLFLWYNSNGYWNDAPQTPRHIMSNSIARRKEMAWMQSIGIRGIKVDFFGSDKQVTMQLYEDILADANDFDLMVIFHGCTLPRGWERMYPNFVSSEAVLASEMLHFSQDACEAEAFNASLHPFIRNAVGSMDFGGSTLNRYYNPQNSGDQRGGIRRTSEVFALATAVLFQSAVQHFALAPNNLTDAPKWAIDFMKEVPSTWDEIRFLDGYPGKYVVLARRKGEKWYVAGVNAEKETVKIKVKLPMFNADDLLTVYRDDEKLNGQKTSIRVDKDHELEIQIPCNGGFVLLE